jgi:hypothetical protein
MHLSTAPLQAQSGPAYACLDAPQLKAADSNQFTQLLGTNYYAYAVPPQLEELEAAWANAIIVHLNFPILCQSFYTYTGAPALYQQGLGRLSLFSV